jgi:hypothetical protein
MSRLPRSKQDLFNQEPPLPGLTARSAPAAVNPPYLTLFLGGNVMSGRGIDQILPYPGDPRVHEL